VLAGEGSGPSDNAAFSSEHSRSRIHPVAHQEVARMKYRICAAGLRQPAPTFTAAAEQKARPDAAVGQCSCVTSGIPSFGIFHRWKGPRTPSRGGLLSSRSRSLFAGASIRRSWMMDDGRGGEFTWTAKMWGRRSAWMNIEYPYWRAIGSRLVLEYGLQIRVRLTCVHRRRRTSQVFIVVGGRIYLALEMFYSI
jgi:hypothetical protein